MSAGEVAATPQESPAEVVRSLAVDPAKGLNVNVCTRIRIFDDITAGRWEVTGERSMQQPDS